MPKTIFHIIILSVGFVLVNAVLYSQLGVVEDSDTERYLGYAQEIREKGIFFKPHEFWYVAYPLFIIGMTSLYNSLGMVVVGQLSLSYLAMLSVYASAKRLHNNPQSGLIAGSGFWAFFMIPYWNFEIYCESILISFNCLAFYSILRWTQGSRGLKAIIPGSIAVLMAVFSKPTGVALLAGMFALLVVLQWSKLTNRPLKFLFLVAGALSLLVLTNFMLSTFTFVRDYKIGEVIYNLEVLPFKEHEKWLTVAVPEKLYLPNESLPPLLQLFLLVLMNPWYAFKLFIAKLFYYLFYIRPYYSWVHNVYMLLILLPMYGGFIQGIRSPKVPRGIKVLVSVFLLVSILSTTLMTIDWRSRFLVAVLPWVFIVGSGSLANTKLGKLLGK